jgi:hypothetical protein
VPQEFLRRYGNHTLFQTNAWPTSAGGRPACPLSEYRTRRAPRQLPWGMRERCCASQQWHPARYLRGLGGLLRARGPIETVRSLRPVNTPPLADLLLETAAVRPHANPESAGSRRSTPASHPPRQESRASPTNVPWHMAKTIASGVGMTNAWLQEQGLLSLKSLWAELAPLRRTALLLNVSGGPARYVVWAPGRGKPPGYTITPGRRTVCSGKETSPSPAQVSIANRSCRVSAAGYHLVVTLSSP